jgi:alpha,alpha-trehalose phosphorylase
MRNYFGRVNFSPRLPTALTRLRFGIECRGRRVAIEIDHKQAAYTMLDGESIEIAHHGDSLRLERGSRVVRPIPPPPLLEPPTQPRGRAPARRAPRR